MIRRFLAAVHRWTAPKPEHFNGEWAKLMKDVNRRVDIAIGLAPTIGGATPLTPQPTAAQEQWANDAAQRQQQDARIALANARFIHAHNASIFRDLGPAGTVTLGRAGPHDPANPEHQPMTAEDAGLAVRSIMANDKASRDYEDTKPDAAARQLAWAKEEERKLRHAVETEKRHRLMEMQAQNPVE